MRPGLLTKLALALAAVGFIPVALVTYQLIGLNREAMTTQVLRTHAVAARTAADRTAAYLSTLLIPVSTATERSEFASDPSGPEAQAILSDVLQAQPTVIAVEVTDPDNHRAYLLQRREYRDVIEAALAAGPPGPDEILNRSDGAWLRLDRPFGDGAGWTRIVANAQVLLEIVAPEEIGEAAELALIARSDERILLQSHAGEEERFSTELRAAAHSGRVSGTGRFGDSLGGFAPVPGVDWVVVSQQPAAIAEQIVHDTQRGGIIAAATAGVLVLAFSAIGYASVVRPIQQLITAQRELVGAEAAAGGGNELEVLRRSFELLAARVREKGKIDDVYLGRYRVNKVLGEGSMGTVFLAWDPKLEREVAIKTIKLSDELPDVKREEFVSLLLKEARLIAGINHENIVGVFDVEDAPEAPFVAMEYVEGLPLSELIQSRGRLDVPTTVHIGLGIARGLEAAHAAGIVHHDIKPSNVLVRKDGSVKIMDFGIAEAVSALAEKREQICGTPGYLPPETIRGQGSGPLGDVYALGVSLYECLSGRRAFGGKTLRDILAATVQGQVRPLGEVNPDIPAELMEVIAILMHPTPERRAPSATAACERLEVVNRALPNAVLTAAIPTELLAEASRRAAVRAAPAGAASAPSEHRTRVIDVSHGTMTMDDERGNAPTAAHIESPTIQISPLKDPRKP